MKLTRVINYLTILALALGTILALIYPSVYIKAMQTPSITVSVPLQIIGPGQQFSIYIEIQPNNPIAGAQFNLSFNPALVTAQSVNEGSLLNQDGADTFFTPGQIDNSYGTISGVAGTITDPSQTISGSGTLAIINMTATQSVGKCPLTLSKVIFSDASAQSIPITVGNGQVEIQGKASMSLSSASGGEGSGQGQNNLVEASGGSPESSPIPETSKPASSNEATMPQNQSTPLMEKPVTSNSSIITSGANSDADGLIVSSNETQAVLTGETTMRNSSAGLSLFIKLLLGSLFIFGFICGLIVHRVRWQRKDRIPLQ